MIVAMIVRSLSNKILKVYQDNMLWKKHIYGKYLHRKTSQFNLRLNKYVKELNAKQNILPFFFW